MSTSITLVLYLLGAFVLRVATALENKQMVFAAYVPEYRAGIDWDFFGQHVTDFILFSVEPLPDGDLKPYFPIDDEGPDSALVKAHRARNNSAHTNHLESDADRLRLLLCVGGAGRSAHFRSVTSTKAKRTSFLKNLLEILTSKQLQGIDFDWETPSNRNDINQYQMLLQEAANMLRPRGFLVTATLHAWQDIGVLAYASLDRVHLMSYDARGTTHSSYETALMDVQRLVGFNCPKSKIVLGVPFYGRGLQNAGLVLTYNDLVQKVGADLDPTSDILGTGKSAIGFNNVLTVQRKTKYAIKESLAGIFAWEIGQDSNDPMTSLTKAISDVRMGIKRKRFQKKDASADPRFTTKLKKKGKKKAAKHKKKRKRRIVRKFNDL
jgi:GH18 family chitinase